MDEPALRIDHVALPCYDAEATRTFYGERLGLPLTATFHATSALWGDRAFTYLAFALGDGALLDFFAIEGVARPESDPVPVGARHLALAVRSRGELEAGRARLAAAGVFLSEPVDHGAGRLSLYCFDPNGHQLELTHRPAPPPGPPR